jgi:hypothetical protein
VPGGVVSPPRQRGWRPRFPRDEGEPSYHTPSSKQWTPQSPPATPFADLRGLTVEALEQESTRLHETIADWTDGDGDQRRYNSIVARASEVNSRIAGHVVA